MHKGFGGTAFEPLPERRDHELTLGPTTLMALGFGLLALCGICFVFGYAVGHRSPPLELKASQTAPAGPSAAQILSAQQQQAKPAATQSSFAVHPEPVQQVVTVPENPAVRTSASGPAASTAVPPPVSTPAVVQATFPAQPTTGHAGSSQAVPVSTSLVRPALPQAAATSGETASSWMVQIATVSNPEDAQLLVGALRKRGYAVSVHHDPIDALLHVQVGPFASHDVAASMRQKLLNDGYNAILQP